jgi:UPF0716 protein FxsA
MLVKLFLLFTIVPTVELYLLIQIGKQIGGIQTIAIVIAMGMLGAALARAEGLRVLREWQEALGRGTVPADGVVSGVLILLGGVLLITPGVLSDIAGLLLFIPPVRRAVAHYVTRRLERAVASGSVRVVQSHPQQRAQGFTTRRPITPTDVIDVESEPAAGENEASRSGPRLP